jgi:lipopolysaccharide biosynthesis glycosyltransferase
MKKSLNVIFTIDKNFIQHFTVSLVSLFENNKDIDLTIFVINDLNDLRPLKNVSDFIKTNYNKELHFLQLENSVFDHYKVNSQYTKATYYRLLITEIVPEYVEKALFLDADTVVAGSLLELAKHEFGQEYILAVEDAEPELNTKRIVDLGYPAKKYFNAGVMLINLKAWRADNLASVLMGLADQYMSHLKWYDQDVLNICLYDRWQMINPKYNAIHLAEELSEMPVVIHWAGAFKPWVYAYDPPYKKLYWKYIKLTPFKDAKYPDFTVKQILRKNYYLLKKEYFPNFKLPVPVKTVLKKFKQPK